MGKRWTVLLAAALAVSLSVPVEASWLGDVFKGIGGAIMGMPSSSSGGGGTKGTGARSGNLWTDESAQIQAKQFKKIVLFPIRYLDEPEGTPDEFPAFNNTLHKEANKRIKKVNFLGFGAQLEEKKYILRDNPAFDALTGHYDSKEARAKAVYDTTAADGYLVPHISADATRVDVSPATWTTVLMESYVNDTGGPGGDRYKINYRSWDARHLVPEARRTLQILDMDFTLYDAYTGKKAMTYTDYARNYGQSQERNFNEITRDLTKAWARLRKDKDQKPKAGAPSMGFGHFNLPDNVGDDELAIKTIYYAVKDEAGDRMKRVRVEYGDGADYYVEGDVLRYESGETWHDPYATATPSLVRRESYTWYDKDNKKHTGHRDYYDTRESDIIDHYGYSSFWYHVAMNLRLVNAATGEVVLSTYDEDTDDCYNDALRHILRAFYERVEDTVGVK